MSWTVRTVLVTYARLSPSGSGAPVMCRVVPARQPKVIYDTRDLAQGAATALLTTPDSHPQYPYRCDEHWHLSKFVRIDQEQEQAR